MKTLLTLLISFAVLASRAGPLDDFLTARPELRDVRDVQRALAAPTVVLSTNQVPRDSATVVDERRIRQTVVPELMTRVEWDGLRDEARERRVKRLLEQRILGATNDTQRLSALYLERRVSVQVERITRDGGEPWGANAEQTTVTVVIATPGPSWWETNGGGQPLPGKEAIRAALLARARE
jgi:hypothetical protein